MTKCTLLWEQRLHSQHRHVLHSSGISAWSCYLADNPECVQMLDKAGENQEKADFMVIFSHFPKTKYLKISSLYSPTPKEIVVLKKNFLS